MKFSQYNYFTNCKDGIAIVNTYNSKYVKFTNDEDIDHLAQLYQEVLPLSPEDNIVKSLYEHGYIVDSDVDEYKLAKEELETKLKNMESLLQIMLYVTDQCNFRCVYCPQKHESNVFSDKNWEALYKYIQKNIKSGKYKNVQIFLFGGEPLLEINKIIPFLEKLKDLSKEFSNIGFQHHITTNGYLLTPEIYTKLVSLNVLRYQITLDGFAETHNKTRHLAGGQGTWDKIVENLKFINTQKDNASVQIRTNYNSFNVKTLEEFQKWEKETFDNPKFTSEYMGITEFSNLVPSELLSNPYSEDSYKIEEKLQNGMEFLRKMKSVCVAAYPSFYSITTKGQISKCENISGEDYENEYKYIGHLSEDGDFIFNNNIDGWFKDFEMEGCKSCVVYPICGARACPTKKIRDPKARMDCVLVSESFEKNINHLFENNI